MTANAEFFVCQNQSGLFITVNGMYRTDFHTFSAMGTARTDIFLESFFLNFSNGTEAFRIRLIYLMMCIQTCLLYTSDAADEL